MILLPVAARDGVVYGMNNRTGAIVPFAFSRASGATLFDSNLDMQMVTANLPRIDFGNYAKTAKLLVERESTNLIPYSNEFDKWGQSRTACQQTAEKLFNFEYYWKISKTESGTSVGIAAMYATVANIGDTCRAVINAKKSNSSTITAGIYQSGSAWGATDVHVVKILKGQATIANENGLHSIVLLSEEVTVEITRFFNTHTGSCHCYAYPGSVYSVSVTDSKIASVSFTKNEETTSYIPTSGSQATRAAETLSINLPQNTEVYLKTTKQEATLSKTAGTWNIHNDIENDGIEVLAIMKY